MPSFGCDVGVNVEERCLDEKLIGILRERDDTFDIPLLAGEMMFGNFNRLSGRYYRQSHVLNSSYRD